MRLNKKPRILACIYDYLIYDICGTTSLRDNEFVVGRDFRDFLKKIQRTLTINVSKLVYIKIRNSGSSKDISRESKR